MVRQRRKLEVFSLSFLDCICCGFGAVVLTYMLIAAQAGLERIRHVDETSAEVNRLEEEVLEGTRNLVILRNTLEKTEIDTRRAATRTRDLLQEIEQTRSEALRLGATSMAQRESIEKLKADVRALEQGTRRLEGGAVQAAPAGERVRSFRGTGNRKYVTGITLKGKRILILFDRSASMLDSDLVNVLKLRNSPVTAKRAAAKWRHSLDVADWLSTQFPAGSQFQLYAFNTQAQAIVPDSHGKWLDSADPKVLAQAVDGLRSLAPEGGTSLINAFAEMRKLSPQPDQVVLITDGMPTQGAQPPATRRYVDAQGRSRLFDEAARSLPEKLPIDVILLPMLGDLPAPHRFWALARRSGGAFLMPSGDWP